MALIISFRHLTNGAGSGYYDARQSNKWGLCSDNPLYALTWCGNDSIGIGYVMSSRLLWQVTAGKKIIFLSVSNKYSIFHYQRNGPRPGLHKLWYPGIRDTSTWSKLGAHGEHGDVFLFSNLGALWFSENLIRHKLHICLRFVKNNFFSFKHPYLRHFSWRF